MATPINDDELTPGLLRQLQSIEGEANLDQILGVPPALKIAAGRPAPAQPMSPARHALFVELRKSHRQGKRVQLLSLWGLLLGVSLAVVGNVLMQRVNTTLGMIMYALAGLLIGFTLVAAYLANYRVHFSARAYEQSNLN